MAEPAGGINGGGVPSPYLCKRLPASHIHLSRVPIPLAALSATLLPSAWCRRELIARGANE